MRWVEEWKKAQAWGFPCHPKKYPRGTSVKAWGCPRGTPSSSAKIRSPFNTLYFYCFMHYAFFLEHLVFSFQFCLVLFAAINGWTPINSFGEVALLFICQEHSVFHSYRFNECSSFSRTAFSFCFSPWFVFRSCYIFASRCILTSGPCWFSSKELFQKRFEWCWKREKALCKKKLVQKGACVDCGLGFCMSCLMSFW
jgi:hypothetical protein